GERADEIVARSGAVPVALAVIRRLDFGDPVDELQAVRARGADRIDHHLSVRQPTGAPHARARQDRLPARRAAPHVDAGITRLAFVGIELLAHRRIDAVAGDGDATARGDAVPAARAVAESHGHAALVLRNTKTMMVGDDPISPGPRAKSLQQ